MNPSPPFIYEHVGSKYITANNQRDDHDKIQSAIYALFRLIMRDTGRGNLKDRSYWENYIPNNSSNMRDYIIPACTRLNIDPNKIWKIILDVIYIDRNDIEWYRDNNHVIN